MKLKTAVGCIPLLALAMVGCTQQSTGQSAKKTTTTSVQSNVDFTSIPGQFPAPGALTSVGETRAPVGACVTMSGDLNNTQLEAAECTSLQANYRVIQRVSTPDQCVADADRRFYENSPQGQYTACLDIVWDGKDCYALEKFIRRVACAQSSGQQLQKPVKLITSTTNANDCPNDGAVFPHPVRRFTVCMQTQK